MKCVICKSGDVKAGKAIVTLNRDDSVVIIKDVPADVCENCGEYYLSEKVTDEILLRAENAVKNKAEIEIIQYAA